MVRVGEIDGEERKAHPQRKDVITNTMRRAMVPVVTSVTTARRGRWETPLGTYEFRHVKADLFFGYRPVEVSPGQHASVATLEKALLDLA